MTQNTLFQTHFDLHGHNKCPKEPCLSCKQPTAPIFVRESPQQTTYQRQSLCKPCRETRNMSREFHYLFSYGSNNISQLTDRIGSTHNHKPAILSHYIRCFGGYSEYRKGAVAFVHPHPGGQVRGWVCLVTGKQLYELDLYEGVPDYYVREEKEVQLMEGGKQGPLVKATLYMKAQGRRERVVRPSDEYLRAVYETWADWWSALEEDTGVTDMGLKEGLPVKYGLWTKLNGYTPCKH